MEENAGRHKRAAAVKLYADMPLSEQAISHAVDMARTEAHKLGDEAFQRAFAQALWRQWCAQALPEYNAYLLKEVKAICTCGFTCDANGNPGDEHIPRWKVTDLLE